MMRSTPSPAALALLAAAAFATLASCSPGTSEGSSDTGRSGRATPGATAATSGPAATPSPSPTGPCADGTCEIEVAVGDVVTVPERYGLGPIEVTAITGGEVRMAAPLTGPGYSVAGCSGGGGVSSDGSGGVTLRCGEGPAATINDAMSLQVAELRDAAAVLRIEPAR